MLLTNYNINFSSGNPSGITNLLPGGAGPTQISGSTPAPMIGTPTIEGIQREVNDYSLTAQATPAVVAAQGALLVLLRQASNTGCASWGTSQNYGHPEPDFNYGVVNKIAQQSDEPGAECTVICKGPAQALCTTGANAITYGSLLISDGAGNLTTPTNPSAAPTPTVTPTGGSATDYSYALVAVGAYGTYSAIGTPGSTTVGAATLSVSAYNTITWTPVDDAVGYYIMRTASSGTPSTVGTIGYAPAGQNSFVDNGLVILPNTTATQPFQLLAAPSTPTVTGTGATGSTTYTYKVTSIAPNGLWSAESSGGSNTSSPATLSTTNYNTVTWSNVTGASRYAVHRTAPSGSAGFIGYAQSGTTGLADYGQTASTFTAVTTPSPTPPAGSVLAVSMGTLTGSTTTPTLVNVCMGGY